MAPLCVTSSSEIGIDLLGASGSHSMLLRCVAALFVPWQCEFTEEVSPEVVAGALCMEGYAAFCTKFGAGSGVYLRFGT